MTEEEFKIFRVELVLDGKLLLSGDCPWVGNPPYATPHNDSSNCLLEHYDKRMYAIPCKNHLQNYLDYAGGHVWRCHE